MSLTLKTTVNKSYSNFEELTINGTETISSLLMCKINSAGPPNSFIEEKEILREHFEVDEDRVWYLNCFYTVERFRNNGFGKILLHEHIFKKYKGDFIILDANSDLAPMYYHLGFRVFPRLNKKHNGFMTFYKDLRG